MNLSSTLLYHYADKPYDVLLTLASQRARGMKVDEQDLKRRAKMPAFACLPQPYDHSFSFFLDPVPLEYIRQHLPKGNFFNRANELYVHVVSALALEDLAYFTTAETHTDQLFLDALDDEALGNVSVFSGLQRVKEFAGEAGTTKEGLLRAMSAYKGRTREAYEWLRLRNDFKELGEYVAGGIPHVLAFSPAGALLPLQTLQVR